MVSGTLYTYAESFRGFKSRIAAEFSGSTLKVVEQKAGDTASPTFESDDKKVKLIESNSIAFYVSNDQMRGGSDLIAQTEIMQWMNYSSTDLASAVASWVYPSLSLVETTTANLAKAKVDLKRCFQTLNDHLKTRTFLVGERCTLADICVACDLLLAYKHVADEAFRKPFVNTNRWFQTVVNQTQFSKISGQVTLCVKAEEFDANKFAAVKNASKTEMPKAEKPKAEAKKPEPKKPEPKEEDEEMEEEDYESKKPDPFAAMPKGTFNMDEFKRTYSNEDTKTVALPYFWKNFEKEFYSIWYCEYKYPEELSLVFMSSNLIAGMFQRIEKLRKNAFASMAVFGENNNNTLAGVWFWKGQELVFPLCSDWTTDYESYHWRKLNPEDEGDKKLLNDMFAWDGEVKGKKFNAGKIFK